MERLWDTDTYAMEKCEKENSLENRLPLATDRTSIRTSSVLSWCSIFMSGLGCVRFFRKRAMTARFACTHKCQYWSIGAPIKQRCLHPDKDDEREKKNTDSTKRMFIMFHNSVLLLTLHSPSLSLSLLLASPS